MTKQKTSEFKFITTVLGPPVGGALVWLGFLMMFVSSSEMGFFDTLGMLAATPLVIVYAYIIGIIPAAIAGRIFFLLPNTILTELTMFGMFWRGAISGLLAVCICVLVLVLVFMRGENMHSIIGMLLILGIVGSLSGGMVACAYKHWIAR